MPLKASSPKAWLLAVQSDFDRFLQDHAACERKASALAMSLVARYPDREPLLEPMICLAKEELAHFHEVFRLMQKRGVPLSNDEKDPYVSALLRHVRHSREEHFLDKLLISAVIEARGCERFGMVAEALDDPELQAFYRRLAREEAGHYMIFLRIARLYFSPEELSERLEYLLEQEATIMLAQSHRPAVH
ncbi:MAG: tRNA-(ms[2]io[6]A)-hydroxylase [Oligoflexus sp.]